LKSFLNREILTTHEIYSVKKDEEEDRAAARCEYTDKKQKRKNSEKERKNA
jgi:hypothetical protein